MPETESGVFPAKANCIAFAAAALSPMSIQKLENCGSKPTVVIAFRPKFPALYSIWNRLKSTPVLTNKTGQQMPYWFETAPTARSSDKETVVTLEIISAEHRLHQTLFCGLVYIHGQTNTVRYGIFPVKILQTQTAAGS